MTIYTKLGEVEGAMHTLAVPQTILDRKNGYRSYHGKIQFKMSPSYGQKIASVNEISFTIEPGEKIGLVGASGAGNLH